MKKILIGLLALTSISAFAETNYTSVTIFKNDEVTVKAVDDFKDCNYRKCPTVIKKGQLVRLANIGNTLDYFCQSKGFQEAILHSSAIRGQEAEALVYLLKINIDGSNSLTFNDRATSLVVTAVACH